MRIRGLYVLCYCCLFPLLLSAQAPAFLDVLIPQTTNLRSSAPNVVAEFQLDASSLKTAYQSGLPDQLDWPLPIGERTRVVTLTEVQIWGPQFQVFNSANRVQKVDLGRHYHYTQQDTLISLSIFENRLTAQISFKQQTYTLGASKNQLFYYGLVKAGPSAALGGCATSDELEATLIRRMQKLTTRQVDTRSQLPPIDIYFELDHFLYQEQGESIAQSLDYFASIFNNVQLIFAREGINVRVHSVKVWNEPDDFLTSSGGAAFRSFRRYLIDTQANPSWDMAVLVSRYSNEDSAAPNGGMANVDGLCNSSKRQAFANIGSTAAVFPEYSWSVFLIAHEIGHTLGTPHTHNCSWPNGPLDDCYCPEGDCEDGPAVSDNGGTIMSYCYLRRPVNSSCPAFPGGTNPGVNLLMGFGDYPRNLMQQTISEASCLDNKSFVDLPNLQSDTAAFLAQVNDSLIIERLQIWNNGSAGVDSFFVQLNQGILNFQDTFSAPDLWFKLPKLPAGDTLRLDTTIWWPADLGNEQWTWVVDPQQTVREWHEGDNWKSQALQQNLQFPQLAINMDFKLIDSTHFFSLEQLEINNIGGDMAAPIQIQYFLSLDEQLDANDFQIGNNRNQWLPKKTKASILLTFLKPQLLVPKGTYYLISRVEVIGENIPGIYPKTWTTASEKTIQMGEPRLGWFRN